MTREEAFAEKVYDFVREAVWEGIPADRLRAMIADAYPVVHHDEATRAARIFRASTP